MPRGTTNPGRPRYRVETRPAHVNREPGSCNASSLLFFPPPSHYIAVHLFPVPAFSHRITAYSLLQFACWSVELCHARGRTSTSALGTCNIITQLMSASNSPSLTETFPTELLEQIFLLTSARDILRMSSVRNVTEVFPSLRVC